MPIEVYYTIQDAKGDDSVVGINLPPATTPANALGFLQAGAPILNAMLTGGLKNAGVRFEMDLSGVWGPTALLNSDVQEKAFFSFRGAANALKTLTLPTILEDLFVPGTKFLDLSDSDVAAFVTMMVDGISVVAFGGVGTVQPSTVHGIDLILLEAAREAWGKYRK